MLADADVYGGCRRAGAGPARGGTRFAAACRAANSGRLDTHRPRPAHARGVHELLRADGHRPPGPLARASCLLPGRSSGRPFGAWPPRPSSISGSASNRTRRSPSTRPHPPQRRDARHPRTGRHRHRRRLGRPDRSSAPGPRAGAAARGRPPRRHRSWSSTAYARRLSARARRSRSGKPWNGTPASTMWCSCPTTGLRSTPPSRRAGPSPRWRRVRPRGGDPCSRQQPRRRPGDCRTSSAAGSPHACCRRGPNRPPTRFRLPPPEPPAAEPGEQTRARTVDALDASFLDVEEQATPMHVGTVAVFAPGGRAFRVTRT